MSSRLAADYVKALSRADPALGVVVRDLAAQPVPQLSAERFAAPAAAPAPAARTPGQAAVVAESDALVEELRRADVVVLGVPMDNVGVPSTLKAYFDPVARAGVAFRDTASDPEGLLQGKRAIVFATRGGRYEGTPLDTQTGYIRQFLRFVGIDDVTFVFAEGLAMGEAPRAAALRDARAAIHRLVAEPLAA